jgi:hypothetical protein
MDLLRTVHPIDRIYLAKSAASPLPMFSAHIPTVLLAAMGDEIYFDNNPQITRGLAVLSTEAWMLSVDRPPTVTPLVHVNPIWAPQVSAPACQLVSTRAKPPINSQLGLDH